MTIGKFEKVVCDLAEQVHDLKNRLEEAEYAKRIVLNNHEELRRENNELKKENETLRTYLTKAKDMLKAYKSSVIVVDDISMDLSEKEE